MKCWKDEKKSKAEVGQMENHCGWFETKYPEAPVRYLMIHQTSKVSKFANFTHDIRIVTPVLLDKLKNQIRAFVNEFKLIDLHSIDELTIAKFLKTHNLDINSIENNYCEKSK